MDRCHARGQPIPGKPPDFVLEVASERTAEIDLGQGVLEYWRFDETGEFRGVRLAGDRLVDGVYAPFPIEELPDGILQGYSFALNLNIRWENGQLGWCDPDTGRPILTYEDQRDRAGQEHEARVQAENRADNAEAHARELETELQRLRQD